MKLILVLITLLIIGLLVKTQLNPSSPQSDLNNTIGNNEIIVPEVPTAPKDVKQFEQDMNKFVIDAAEQRAKEIDQAVNPE